jgi:hypothetical protein
MRPKEIAGALLTLILLAPVASAAEVYRWVDADGVVQFGANPPPGVKAESMKVRGGGAAPAVAPSAQPAPEPQPDAVAQENARKLREEAERVRLECAKAREIVSRLRENPAASYAREDGSYQRYGDDEREQRIQQALDFQREHCD